MALTKKVREDVDAWIEMELNMLEQDEMNEESKDYIRKKIMEM